MERKQYEHRPGVEKPKECLEKSQVSLAKTYCKRRWVGDVMGQGQLLTDIECRIRNFDFIMWEYEDTEHCETEGRHLQGVD